MSTIASPHEEISYPDDTATPANAQSLFKKCKYMKLDPSQRRKIEFVVIFGTPSTGETIWIAGKFNTETQKSALLARLTFRENAAVVSVGGGNVMIIGGDIDGKSFSSCVEIFSCRKRLSRPIAPLGGARWYHGACAVGDKVVVCGGRDEKWNALNSCEIYSEGQWWQFPAMQETRVGVAVVSSPDRRVFAIGGSSRDGSLSSVEVCRLPIDFDSSTQTPACSWRSIASMHTVRWEHAAVILQGSIFVVGASSVEMLPNANEEAQWVLLLDSKKMCKDNFSLVVFSEEIFSFGGDFNSPNSVERLKVKKRRNEVSTSTSNSFIEEIMSARWESFSIIDSMTIIHRAVLL